MDDAIESFGRSRSSPSPKKRKIDNPVDPGIVDVELKCDRWSVEAKWLFGASLMKGDLLAAKVDGYARGLVWNVPQKKGTNQDRESEAPYVDLTCPSLGLLRELCRACEASQCCSHWFITGRDGKRTDTVPCEWNRTHKRPLRNSANTENTRRFKRRRSERRH